MESDFGNDMAKGYKELEVQLSKDMKKAYHLS